ncbi:MAG TPA: metabolite traffic protein EboE [Nitrospiraceae bacterium]|nr:metabolite traffic protein EboE [Nitrospiraceae bacterium]
MMLGSPGHPHLTYCTNIHPGETWDEVRDNLQRYLLNVKAQVAPDRPFGIGLRLSAQAADDLAKPAALEAFSSFLQTHDLYVFTLNGFPYGQFHEKPVKEQVYLPDWLDERRLRYTNQLAELLAALLPLGSKFGHLEGSISTVPGAFRSRITGDADVACLADRLLRHLAVLHHIRERTGRIVSLALEPEPCCFLETVAETIAFFEGWLFSQQAVDRLGTLTGMARRESEAFLRRHLGVCVDACHMAVEFEDPDAVVRALQAAGIRIGKIQISAGLRVWLDDNWQEHRASLTRFSENVYLHQVVERRHGTLTRYTDLPDALEALSGAATGDAEWRIHFHVPLFCEHLGLFVNTQEFLRRLLVLIRTEALSQHLEIETYTWHVLPEEYRSEDIVTSITRELRWVLQQVPCDLNG